MKWYSIDKGRPFPFPFQLSVLARHAEQVHHVFPSEADSASPPFHERTTPLFDGYKPRVAVESNEKTIFALKTLDSYESRSLHSKPCFHCSTFNIQDRIIEGSVIGICGSKAAYDDLQISFLIFQF